MIKRKKFEAPIHTGERAFEAFHENVAGNFCGRMYNGARQRGNALSGRCLGRRRKVASLVLAAILSFGLCGAGAGAPAAYAATCDGQEVPGAFSVPEAAADTPLGVMSDLVSGSVADSVASAMPGSVADGASGKALSQILHVQGVQTQACSLQAPVVTVMPRGDGGVSITWTESPLTSTNPDEDMRSYNLYLYDGDKSGALKTMTVQYGLVNLDFAFTEGWFWAGKRYTVAVEAVNDARPDDPNGTVRSEYVSFTAPDKPTGIIGDVNDNGVLNAVDAQIAYDLATTSAYMDAPEYADLLSRADVTFDGTVDAVDAFAVQRAALLGWGA